MQCPNRQCNNRALSVQATTDEITVTFKEDGKTIDSVEYGEWYLTDDGEASCDVCHWQGFYRDCKEGADVSEPY